MPVQHLFVRQDRRPLDGVLERPHVPGPRLLAKPRDSGLCEGHRAAQPPGHLCREVLSEWGYVLPPFGERREMNRDDI